MVIYRNKSYEAKVSEIYLMHSSCLQIQVVDFCMISICRSSSNLNAELTILGFFVQSPWNNKKLLKYYYNGRHKHKYHIYNHGVKNTTGKIDNYLNMLVKVGILPGQTLPTRQDNCSDHFMIKIERKLISVQIAIAC